MSDNKKPTITINPDAPAASTVQSPSETIVKASNTVERVTAGALTLGLKKPGVLAQYRIVEVVGDSAKNQTYMGMVIPLLWVVEIDGFPMPAPSTKRELEALITRLGDEGVAAVMEHLQGKATDAGSDESIKN